MQAIDESMAVNLKSAVKLSQCALASLQRSGGSIVNVSSIAGLRAWPGALAYKMSKAAMDQMTRCVALEVGDIYSYIFVSVQFHCVTLNYKISHKQLYAW